MAELVSVVVPVYNVEKYLDRCLRSITGQTYRDLEILLVDDGSTDSSGTLCDRWAREDSRIRVIHKQNAGAGMARNTGIDHASGKYIFFFDSDDYVDISAVETCVTEAERSGTQIVLYGRNYVYDDAVVKQGRSAGVRVVFKGEEVKRNLLPTLFTYELGVGVSPWGKMYRLDVLKNHGLRFKSEREIFSEDAYFSMELFSKISDAVVLPERLYFYCIRGNSLSRAYQADRQRQVDDFLQQCTAYIHSASLPPELAAHIQSRYHGMTMGTLLQIIRSGLTQREKRRELKKIYTNQTLCGTLSEEVVALDAKLPRLFWRCLRYRCHWLCTGLLYINAWK